MAQKEKFLKILNYYFSIPLIRKDIAVLNFIVTHVGTILFRVSRSSSQPIITTSPIIITTADKIRVISKHNLDSKF